MSLRIELLPRPWSGHQPRVPGYEPLISHRITRVDKRRRNSWRCEILVDGCPMSTSHHDLKSQAESKAAAMLEAYTEAHYVST